MMRTRAFHTVWFKITAIVAGSFGPVFFVAAMARTLKPARFTLDLLSRPLDGATTWASPETRCLSGLVHDVAPRCVRRSVLTGTLAWYCLDSAGSVASDNASTAAFGVLVLLAAAGPLRVPAKD